MMRGCWIAALTVSAVCGCGGTPDSDPQAGGAALRTALEAWKAGKSPDDLQKQSPSIVMNDPDWRLGKTLLEFKMDESSIKLGRQVRWDAKIKLKDKAGDAREVKAKYVIDTTPRIVIVRDDQL